ncbi:helix-turn-helix domain-containing protein [Alkaliphilus crotonatoxidans]
MRVLSRGEKIKELRTRIGLKQDDISNDEITRSLISMIENNKRNLTFKTARVISDALNKYYINLGKEITPDLLLESEVEQAQRMIRERLDEMRELLDNPTAGAEKEVYSSFQRLIDFAKEWNLQNMIAELKEARGRFYYKTYQYNKGLKDFFDVLEYHLKYENYHKVASMYNLIGSSLYQLDSPDQALLYYEKVYDTIITHHPSNYDLMKILVRKNKILCYIKLKRYDTAFSLIAEFKEFYNKEDEKFYEIILMEANTYLEVQNYTKAAKIFNKLLKKSTKFSRGLLFLVYESYADLYIRKGEYQHSIDSIESALQYADDGEPNVVAYLYLFEAKAYLELSQVNKAHSIVEEGLVYASKVSETNVVIGLSIIRAQIDIHTNCYDQAEKKLNWLEEYVLKKAMKEKLNEIYLCYIELYCKKKDMKKCLEYTYKAQSIKFNVK